MRSASVPGSRATRGRDGHEDHAEVWIDSPGVSSSLEAVALQSVRRRPAVRASWSTVGTVPKRRTSGISRSERQWTSGRCSESCATGSAVPQLCQLDAAFHIANAGTASRAEPSSVPSSPSSSRIGYCRRPMRAIAAKASSPSAMPRWKASRGQRAVGWARPEGRAGARHAGRGRGRDRRSCASGRRLRAVDCRRCADEGLGHRDERDALRRRQPSADARRDRRRRRSSGQLHAQAGRLSALDDRGGEDDVGEADTEMRRRGPDLRGRRAGASPSSAWPMLASGSG